MRNRGLSTENFRKNAEILSFSLARKTFAKIPASKRSKVALIMILRSALAMLSAFLKYFPKAPVGFIGIKMNKLTAVAKKYYENLPKLSKSSIVVIPDPMLGTAGSFINVLKILIKKGVNPKNVYFTGFIAAEDPGIEKVARLIPKENLTFLAIDPKLDSKYYITPGLGDFGDRYFGYK